MDIEMDIGMDIAFDGYSSFSVIDHTFPKCMFKIFFKYSKGNSMYKRTFTKKMKLHDSLANTQHG